MIRPCLTAAMLALLLSACGDQSAPASGEDDQRKARGEVLGGSISDAMIPLDTLESKSPPLKIEPRPAASSDAETSDEAVEDVVSEPAEATEAAPAEEPSEN
ncbi:hypothetical protein [Erythrobacter mangrovi]|uniref:Argininosuccinate lyase n=1 Tax=Erythrobacter mangrovi TaxID=2739433 RepID=A0A7D4BHB4_9SPHN|nr:hypothetical protein [Erythrobacter mangrovi]QKG72062.1 hypothetical protein HQR01_12185 [Erythrobacter mangrovi]